MLHDPLVRLRMERAGIVPESIETLLRDAKRRLEASHDDRPVAPRRHADDHLG
jgi:hypothetical protein